jgi:hypothetical protein
MFWMIHEEKFKLIHVFLSEEKEEKFNMMQLMIVLDLYSQDYILNIV